MRVFLFLKARLYDSRHFTRTFHIVEHRLGKMASALPHRACLVRMGRHELNGTLPSRHITIGDRDAAGFTVEVDGYLRIVAAYYRKAESKSLNDSGESGGVARRVAANHYAVCLRHVASYLIGEQSAYLLHVDVVSRMATLHGVEIRIGHFRVGIDAYV